MDYFNKGDIISAKIFHNKMVNNATLNYNNSIRDTIFKIEKKKNQIPIRNIGRADFKINVAKVENSIKLENKKRRNQIPIKIIGRADLYHNSSAAALPVRAKSPLAFERK